MYFNWKIRVLICIVNTLQRVSECRIWITVF